MCKYAMIDFYAESREDVIADSSINTAKDYLVRVFNDLTTNYGVVMEDRRITGLNGEVLQRWQNAYKKNHAVTSVNLAVCMLNPFLRWAHTMTSGDECIPYLKTDLSGVLHTLKLPDPEKVPEWERPKPKYYSNAEIEDLMACPHSHNKLRDRAIIAMILGSGLRVSELCSLTIGSLFDREPGTVYVKRKGGAWKETEVADFVYKYVNEYLDSREDKDDHNRPLFVTREGLPCNRHQVYQSLSKIQKRLDLATGPHALRHTFVSEVEKTGGGAVARDLANHKSLVITNRYDHSTREQRKAAVNAVKWSIAE